MHERNYAIDIAKILGCILVVMNHTTLVMTRFSGKVDAAWLLSIVIFFAVKIGVPLFILATGTLVLTRERDYTYSWHHAAKFGLLLIGWSYLYWLLAGNTPAWRLDRFLVAMYQKPVATHLWYLYMLVAFYLMLPFISKMLAHFSKQDYHLFFICWLLFGAAPLTLRNLGGPALTGWIHLELFTGFIGYFICGQYLHHYRISKWFASGLLIGGLAFDAVVTVLFSIRNGSTFLDLDNVLLIPSIMAAVGTYALIMETCQGVRSRTVVHISKLTFGIYLIHYALVTPVSHLPLFENALKTGSSLELLGVQLGIDVIVFAAALIISQVINWIPGVRKLAS